MMCEHSGNFTEKGQTIVTNKSHYEKVTLLKLYLSHHTKDGQQGKRG